MPGHLARGRSQPCLATNRPAPSICLSKMYSTLIAERLGFSRSGGRAGLSGKHRQADGLRPDVGQAAQGPANGPTRSAEEPIASAKMISGLWAVTRSSSWSSRSS